MFESEKEKEKEEEELISCNVSLLTQNTKELSTSLYVLKGCNEKNGRVARIRRTEEGMKEKTWQGKKNETRKRDFVKLTFAGLSMTDWFVGVPIKSLFTIMTVSPGCVVSAVGADSS